MGVDIHVVIEARFGDRWVGVWTDEVVNSVAMTIGGPECFDRPDLVERDRHFFGMLAGVRCAEFEDAFETGRARTGVPEDASDLTRAILEFQEGEYGYHTYGSCDLDTLCEIKVRARTYVPPEGEPEWLEESEALQAKLKGISPVEAMMKIGSYYKPLEFRAVFWFDS